MPKHLLYIYIFIATVAWLLSACGNRGELVPQEDQLVAPTLPMLRIQAPDLLVTWPRTLRRIEIEIAEFPSWCRLCDALSSKTVIFPDQIDSLSPPASISIDNGYQLAIAAPTSGLWAVRYRQLSQFGPSPWSGRTWISLPIKIPTTSITVADGQIIWPHIKSETVYRYDGERFTLNQLYYAATIYKATADNPELAMNKTPITQNNWIIPEKGSYFIRLTDRHGNEGEPSNRIETP